MQVKDLCIVCANNYKTSDKWHDFYYLDTGNLTQNRISELQHFQTERNLPSRAKQKVSKGSILYSSVRPNQLHYGYFEERIPNLLVSTGFIILLPNENLVNGKFLYYFLTQYWVTNKLQSLAQSNVSAYPSISKDDILSIEIDLPDRKTQDKIVEILSGIDEQINRNNEVVKKLQVLGNTIYSKEIHSTKSFECIDCLRIKTGKEDANFATSNGKYKFFTCSEDTFLCDDFAFEGKSILIAGNGNFNVKFSDGKFNAYQRVYVISDEEKYGNLYYTYMHNIQALSQKANGSIIKFLTLDMLKNIQMPIFDVSINKTLNDIVFKIYCTEEQNKKLYELKSNLLPLLINGQLEI